MIDILERLRVWPATYGEPSMSPAYIGSVMKQAADEIEQLRAAQPQYLSNCLHPHNCQVFGMCQSYICDHRHKAIVTRVCVEPKQDGVVYPGLDSST